MNVGGVCLRLVGRESGLTPQRMTDILTRETFYDPAPAVRDLNYPTGDLDRAIREIATGRDIDPITES